MSKINKRFDSLVESAQRLHELNVSIGRPFACPGDVLFVRSNNKFTSKANIQYQKIRRRNVSEDKFRFTHVGIVTSAGVVAHSLSNKGQLIEKILGPDFRAYGFGKSGVTLDSLSSSGFLDSKDEDFLVLRNTKIFNEPELQAKITQSALYYFGIPYNFSIDLKEYLYTEDYYRFMLHCSEFVERVLVDSEIKKPCMAPSNVLPVDNYIDLFGSDNWEDITEDYKSESFYHPNELSAELQLMHQVMLTIMQVQKTRSFAKISSALIDLETLLEDVKKKPDLFQNEINEMLGSGKQPSLLNSLKSIYKILTLVSPEIHKIHISDELLESFLKNSNASSESLGKELLVNLLSNVHRWYAEAIIVQNLVSKGCMENKESVRALLHKMNLRTNMIFVKIETKADIRNGYKVAQIFARLGNAKQRREAGSGLFALTLSCLAQSITRMKVLAMLSIDEVSYSSLIKILLAILPEKDLVNEYQNLLFVSCADLSSIQDDYNCELILDFSKLLNRD